MATPFPDMHVYQPSDADYPLERGSWLFHASWAERRSLRSPAFLASHQAIAKEFATRPEGGGIRREQRGSTPGGFLSRYIVVRQPNLFRVDDQATQQMARAFADRGLVQLHPMPARSGARRGLWLSEIAQVFDRHKPAGIDGWYFAYGRADASAKVYAEYLFCRPMQFLRFWGSVEVTPLQWARRSDPMEKLNRGVPWRRELGELAPLEASSQQMSPDTFVEVA